MNKIKVVLVAPARNVSGGPESIQQLGMALLEHHYDVKIKYIDGGIPDKFKDYNIPVTDAIMDDDDTVVIVPEVFTYLLKEFNHVKKVIWWLSVDNYISFLPESRIAKTLRNKSLPEWLSPLLMYRYRFSSRKQEFFDVYRFDDNKVKHLYNAEYVKDFLIKHGVLEESCYFLTPPISDEYINVDVNILKKQDVIAYNPAKGYEYLEPVMKRLKSLNSSYKFIAIRNMTNEEVASLLVSAKIYIDLGSFPGPDRIPRQAALCFCNILTSRDGAAGNHFDLPIPDEYKFNKQDTNLIANKLNEMLKNYDNEYVNFNEFRDIIIKQKNEYVNRCVRFIESFN
ncbi:hypothetical protein [Lactiplantibacillus pentosus]|uniref:hypothetical protein n=1 Tax=Lactiplantibacillus pentosus TaxID=1589 RepID=UPI001D000240|nr:hypothetical protein [Lactiplantibacillus pentosus]MCB5223311.1 hypothetical protein [Lactiplantibacillus pentosus]